MIENKFRYEYLMYCFVTNFVYNFTFLKLKINFDMNT